MGLDCIEGLAACAFDPDQNATESLKQLSTTGFTPDVPVLFLFCSRVD